MGNIPGKPWSMTPKRSAICLTCGESFLVKRAAKYCTEACRTKGLDRPPEYHIWKEMRQRCTRQSHPKWHRYGGRGIRICERWQDFRNFFLDMGPRPTQRHSIERCDNDGNYEPENCRWATPREQSANTRRNHVIEFRGERLHVSDWARRIGVEPQLLDDRINKLGWSYEKALTTPKLANKGRKRGLLATRRINELNGATVG